MKFNNRLPIVNFDSSERKSDLQYIMLHNGWIMIVLHDTPMGVCAIERLYEAKKKLRENIN